MIKQYEIFLITDCMRMFVFCRRFIIMKKYVVLILMILFVLPLTACGKGDKHVIEIMVPAGSTEAFVYSEEERSFVL